MKRQILTFLAASTLFVGTAAQALADHQLPHNPAAPPGCAQSLIQADDHAALGLENCGQGLGEA